MEKARHTFYTTFKNMPYSDEEWERDTRWRAEFRERYASWAERNPGKNLPRKYRPSHPFKYGPTCSSHEEARKVCEKALAEGAQMVLYSIWGPRTIGYLSGCETWYRRKKGDWYQK